MSKGGQDREITIDHIAYDDALRGDGRRVGRVHTIHRGKRRWRSRRLFRCGRARPGKGRVRNAGEPREHAPSQISQQGLCDDPKQTLRLQPLCAEGDGEQNESAGLSQIVL